MSVLARLEPRQLTGNRPRAARRALELGSVLEGSGAEVIIHDLSVTGLLIETSADLISGETLELVIPEIGATPAKIVWNSGRFFGCQFRDGISNAAVSAALLRSPVSLPKEEAKLQETQISPFLDESAEENGDSDSLSFATKMRVIIGISIALWAAIIWAVSAIL